MGCGGRGCDGKDNYMGIVGVKKKLSAYENKKKRRQMGICRVIPISFCPRFTHHDAPIVCLFSSPIYKGKGGYKEF
jgi:hypothetical protein